METQVELTRLRPTWPAIVVAVAMALFLGGTVGYNLKPLTVAGAPGNSIGVTHSQMDISDYACIWFVQHKGC